MRFRHRPWVHISTTCSPCNSECGSAGKPEMGKAFSLAHPSWRISTAHWCTWAPLESALHDLSRHSCGNQSVVARVIPGRTLLWEMACLAAILAARVMPFGVAGLSWHPAGQSRRGVSRGGTSCRHGSGRRQNGRLFAIGAGVEADVVVHFSLIWTTVLGK